jgi:DNA-binding XRE family transcriptional regulator
VRVRVDFADREGVTLVAAGAKFVLGSWYGDPLHKVSSEPKIVRVDVKELGTALNVAVGNELRALRAKRRLSRLALAAAAGMGVSTIQRFENGERSPDMQQLYVLCQVLNVTVREFVNLALADIE